MGVDRHAADEHFNLALDLFAEGKPQEAVQQYRAALAADPQHIDALHGLVRVLQDLQQYDDAIAAAKLLVELSPEEILPHTSLSILYQKKGMIAEAEAEANQARILGWKQQLKGKK